MPLHESEAGNGALDRLLALYSFLTIIPTGKHDLELAAAAFHTVPLVGATIGLIAGLAAVITPATPLLRAAIAVSLIHVLTGLNHMDGFIDVSDALAARKNRNETYRILKEPWKGAYAITSAVIALMLQVGGIESFLSAALPASAIIYPLSEIILVSVMASEAMFIAAKFGRPPEARFSLGRLFIEASAGLDKSVINSAIASGLVAGLLVVNFVTGQNTLLILALSVAIAIISTISSIVVVRIVHRRIGFVNGDVLGFTYVVSLTAASVAVGTLSWCLKWWLTWFSGL